MLRPSESQARGLQAVIGCGEKPNTAAAIAFAARHGIPYWRMEDGFLRSVGLGVDGDPPLSLVVDDLGICYDARRPSRLEQMLADDRELDDPALLARARHLIDRVVAARLSKYNEAPTEVRLGAPGGSRVLVVDQTRGDLSVACGLASEASFRAMLDAALIEHPHAEIIVKTHPDVLAGKKRGYLQDVAGPRVRVFAEAASPIALLEQVDHVYVVTSQVGLEALLVGKPVTCFGVPFYAGWGLTDDRGAVPRDRRARTRTLAQLVAAAYLRYPRYIDPDTGAPCEAERVLEHLELQRRMFDRHGGDLYCVGFQLWKRRYVRRYLRSPGNRVIFVRSAAHAAARGFGPGAHLVSWSLREHADVRALAARHGVTIWRMEDGFLRSVGLGSELAMPASLVVDRQGIYFDPRVPSELETLLERGDFTDDERARAAALRRAIVARGLSKYNVGNDRRLEVPRGRRVVLVPGQVEDDAAVLAACPGVRGNQALLDEVRRTAPDAYIIYKPHPDVVSGNRRRGRVAHAAALSRCDHVEEEGTLAQCLEVADEVHTLASLVGFEALLRGKRVVVYGQPFYAGWGLTEDRAPTPLPRRTRALTLDELVAGALIRYPTYLNRRTGRFSTPEAIIAELGAERDAGSTVRTVKVSWPRRQLRKLLAAYRGVVHAP